MTRERENLTEAEITGLRILAAAVIPTSATYDMPAADDAAVFKEIVVEAAHDLVGVRDALTLFQVVASTPLEAVPLSERARIAEAFRHRHPAAAACVAGVVVRAYYRDDRVMRAIGMEPRPPFPKGFEVEQGDWSLLDPVRRGPVRWRPVP